jgi:hypothetical protein
MLFNNVSNMKLIYTRSLHDVSAPKMSVGVVFHT